MNIVTVLLGVITGQLIGYFMETRWRKRFPEKYAAHRQMLHDFRFIYGRK